MSDAKEKLDEPMPPAEQTDEREGGGGDEGEKDPDKPEPGASLPERVTFTVAVLLVAALAGFLGWHGFQEATPETSNARPRVTATVAAQRAVSQPQGWAVPVEVTNTGNVPLREVIVKVEVQETDGKPGERELTFGFLAEGASETGYVTTFTAPDADPPTATIQSFQSKADARGY